MAQALPELADPRSRGVLHCKDNRVFASISPAAGHSSSVEIARYDSEAQALAALGRANSSFRGFPALREVKTGYPGPQSLQEMLSWQMSRWLFRISSFDDTPYRIATPVSFLANSLYEAALQARLE